MLERIAEIKGIGLLHDSNGKPFGCKGATLIYADNGRGKSTLSTVFRSLSINDPALIKINKTVDGVHAPKVEIHVDSGHKVFFENGAWSEQRNEFVVFDADFIARNVHSGGVVNTEHRKSLLEFALGETAVIARKAADKAASDWKAAADKEKALAAQLAGYHQGLSVTEFEKLQPVDNIQSELDVQQKKLVDAKNVAAILARPVPKAAEVPNFDFESLFSVLEIELQTVHQNAETLVKEHIKKLNHPGSEEWLSKGLQFHDGAICPFCAQDTTSTELLPAYQTYFNKEYSDAKNKVEALKSKIESNIPDAIVNSFSKSVDAAMANIAMWADQLGETKVSFDASAMLGSLHLFREYVLDLVRQKQENPVENKISESTKLNAQQLWQSLVDPLLDTNGQIETAAKKILKRKEDLAAEDIAKIQQTIGLLEATRRRFDPKVSALVAELVKARSDASTLDKQKKQKREVLDQLMQTLLSKYEKRLNQLLSKFGASFSIRKLGVNFLGGTPRSEYGLELRGKPVTLEGTNPPFSSALSEGDKRALALAFFIASVLEDPNISKKVVVVDDPMCSLDLARRHHTKVVIQQIHQLGAQVVVLAHDPFFLKDLRDALHKKDKAIPIAEFRLEATSGGYSNFGPIDLDQECESKYARRYRLVQEHVTTGAGNPNEVAEAIRPLLEGYLHRRFPGQISERKVFGDIIKDIQNSPATSPLAHAKNLIAELNEINDYAGQFHHLAGPDSSPPLSANPAEVMTFASRALDVIHRGTPP